jgi:hypothetical protein
MAKMEWSEEEVQLLKELYPSKMTVDEMVVFFPKRTINALRLKASRLGIKRPYFKSMVQFHPIKYISNGKKKSSGYLFKCGGCSSWIQFDDRNKTDSSFITCTKCSHEIWINQTHWIQESL